MSTDNSNETVEKIVAEMRHCADRCRQDGWGRIGEELGGLADRIEAAAELERDEARQLAAIAESDASFARCARCDRPERGSAPGNAAAMRDALERIRRVCANQDNADSQVREWAEDFADAALAAPPRNCDRYPSCNAAWKAYNAIDIEKRERLPGFDPWLFEDAKPEGGDHA